MEGYAVIDADAHVTESVEGLRQYLKAENRARPLWTTSSWDMDFGGTAGKKNENNPDPKTQLRDMDADGIDVQVIYPSRGLSLNDEKQPNLAVDVARAYNDWLAEFCSADPKRLKGVAVVALQDVAAAIAEARRAVEELRACRHHDAHECSRSGYWQTPVLAFLRGSRTARCWPGSTRRHTDVGTYARAI